MTILMAFLIVTAVETTQRWGNVRTPSFPAQYVAYNAFNTVASPGGGWGMEVGFALFDKARNLAVPLRYAEWSVPSTGMPGGGEYFGSGFWDFSRLRRVGAGVRYYTGIEVQRGVFFGDELMYTWGSVKDPGSITTGTLWHFGVVTEIGYKWTVLSERAFIESALGLGKSFGGRLVLQHPDATSLEMFNVNGLAYDISLAAGINLW
jgi:hypothetical protein